MQVGTGKLITSGKTVHGSETRFHKELELGDFLIVTIEGVEEKRKLNMVLSDKSCGIDTPFSSDVMIKQEFKY